MSFLSVAAFMNGVFRCPKLETAYGHWAIKKQQFTELIAALTVKRDVEGRKSVVSTEEKMETLVFISTFPTHLFA